MADTMISFRSNDLSTHFLSNDELKTKCPYAFLTEPTNPKVSNKYTMATTIDVVNDMEKLGWYPVEAKQCRTKKNSSGIRSYHIVCFQNPNVKIEGEGYPRILLTSSHDGFNSFKFMCGFYKFSCSNGLIIADEEFAKISIKHINYNFDEIRNMVKTTINRIPNIINTINQMKVKKLSVFEKESLASEFFKIRKNIREEDNNSISNDIISAILKPNREEDDNDSLWSVFNTCQENIIKGNFSITNDKGKTIKQKPITSIKKDVKFNSDFWSLSLNYI